MKFEKKQIIIFSYVIWILLFTNFCFSIADITPETIELKENSSRDFLFFSFIILLVIIFLTPFFYFRKIFKKNIIKFEKYKIFTTQDFLLDTAREIEDTIIKKFKKGDKKESFLSDFSQIKNQIIDDKKDKLGLVEEYKHYLYKISHEFLKIVDSMELTIIEVKKDIQTQLKKGYSWTDIYILLIQNNAPKNSFKKIISFNEMGDYIEEFIRKNKLDKLTKQQIKSLLMKQEWIAYFYISKKKGLAFIDDILFLIEGTKLYGFRKEKFTDLFKEEFTDSIKNINFEKKLPHLLNKDNFVSLNDNYDSLYELKGDFQSQFSKFRDKFYNKEINEDCYFLQEKSNNILHEITLLLK